MQELDALLGSHTPDDGPGLACVALRNGQIIYSDVRGYANVDTKSLISPNTTFRLASVSKQFVAAGILTLVQDKELSLTDTLPEFFPAFPEYGKDITLKHLLTHTSGLKDYETLLPEGKLGPVTDEEVLAIMQGEGGGYFLPGEKYQYSNTGYCLLHLIIERISGQSLDLFLTERIFLPLGMKSAFVHTSGMPDISNMAYGHSMIGGKYEVHNQDMTSWTIGDGGIYASIEDMAAWSTVFLAPHRIGEYDLSEMFLPYVPTETPGRAYGYGLVVSDMPEGRVISHEGETVGFRNCIYAVPGKGLSIIILLNRDDVDPFAICEHVSGLVQGSESPVV